MIAATTSTEIRTTGDPWIASQLERVRLLRRLLGDLPAFRRGQMYFDFDVNRVRVAPVKGGGAC